MDAFYAAIEQRDHPEWRGRPIAVGHQGPRGVVATASYEARRYGIHSAMSSTRAARLCPELIFAPVRMETYKSISRQIQTIFHDYTDLVEPLSLDEAFLDVSHLPSATLLAREIKQRIFEQTALTASAGVSVNKMLAKIASDYRKPDGLFVIPPKAIDSFTATLPVEKFFGIGKVTALRMHELGIHTGADLRQWDEKELIRHFGKAGHNYYEYARGIDTREVMPDRKRKSLGAETTFAEDLNEIRQLKEQLHAVCMDVWKRMDKYNFCGRTITLKVKYDNFRQITRSRTLPFTIKEAEQLQKISLELLESIETGTRKIRLLGISIGNIPETTDAVQLQIDFNDL